MYLPQAALIIRSFCIGSKEWAIVSIYSTESATMENCHVSDPAINPRSSLLSHAWGGAGDRSSTLTVAGLRHKMQGTRMNHPATSHISAVEA